VLLITPLHIRLYGRKTAGSTPIKGANVDKGAGIRARLVESIDSCFQWIETQETGSNSALIGPP
jgi:hypothetical protein